MRMKFDKWVETYKPTGAPVEGKGCGFDGKMFETFGQDVKTVDEHAQKHPHTVWTLVSGEGRDVITAGVHRVNRLGFFICEVPFTRDDIEVRV